MPITLINPFTVPASQDAEFLKRWKHTTDAMSRANGFIDAHMYKNTGNTDAGAAEFLYINVAQWDSADAVGRAYAADHGTESELPGVKAHPGIYTSVVDVTPPATA